MKKLMLVLLICVVIESGKEMLQAGRVIISEVSNYEMVPNKPKGLLLSDKQIVLIYYF